MTEGEKRVRPEHRELTDQEKVLIKEAKDLCAELIDVCEQLKKERPEAARMFALAQTNFENGCMWMVKGITS